MAFFGVSFADVNTGTAVGAQGTIRRTTNGGVTWTGQSSGTLNPLQGVSFTDANTGTAVGLTTQSGTILRTTNGGGTWVSQSTRIASQLFGVSFTDANTGTAVGFDGTIVRTTTGGVVWVKEDGIGAGGKPEQSSLQQNYPNPFNPSTTIRYALPVRSHVTLTIYNPLGQQVSTLVEDEQEEGSHEVQFDASGLPSGMYLYRLTAGSFVQTRKLLLLH